MLLDGIILVETPCWCL